MNANFLNDLTEHKTDAAVVPLTAHAGNIRGLLFLINDEQIVSNPVTRAWAKTRLNDALENFAFDDDFARRL